MFKLKKVILLVLSVLILTISSVAVGSDFSGQWCWDKDSGVSAFTIVVKKVAGIYRGGYFAVAQHGNRIDDNDTAFSFKVTEKNMIKTKLKSGIDGSIGLIQLKIRSDNKMEWLVLQKPKGEFFFPQEAMLHRCQ